MMRFSLLLLHCASAATTSHTSDNRPLQMGRVYGSIETESNTLREYIDPRTRIESSQQEEQQQHHQRTKPMHMVRKSKLHQTKAHLEHDQIEVNIQSIQDTSSTSAGFLRGRRDNNFGCNDHTELTNSGYSCKKMDQSSFISNADLGSLGAQECGFDYINDIWGWESSVTGKKYALAGMWDGTSFVDITDERNPMVLGFLETAGKYDPKDCGDSFWRDVKVVNDVAYIGSEVEEHGIQTFNLYKLDLLARPTTKVTRKDVPRVKANSHIDSIGSSHNLIEFPDMDKILVVGFDDADECSVKDGETVAVLSVGEDPYNPTVECLALGDLLNTKNQEPYALMNSYAGYVHDGQCFVYNGPDTKYTGRSICVFFAETEIGIYDMTNREMINVFSYDGATYVHQGWVSEDFTTLYANDENDEECRSGELDHCRDLNDPSAFPITRIFDISSLENIGEPRQFINSNAHSSIDHNMYVKGDYIYSANYEAGARVYKILEDKSLEEVAYFDVSNDCDDIKSCADPFGGVWTHFPFSDSTTIASNGFYGLHVFQTRLGSSIFD